jgi:FdhD protein
MTAPVLTDSSAMRRLGYARTVADAAAVRIDLGCADPVVEMLAEETPVTIAYNLVPHAVMMATPADLEDFAIGFSLTEGIVDRAADVTGVSVVRYSRGIELQIELAPALATGAARTSRRLSGRTGCGICGMESVEQVLRAVPNVHDDSCIDAAAVTRAMRELAERQPLNALTGAVHAAAWARHDGVLAYVREDVGRHNALDKLTGALVRADVPAHEGFVVITSRGSFELVQKAAILGVPLLAAVSAPTALAVRMAHSAGLTLAGFARGDRMTVYTHAERIRL